MPAHRLRSRKLPKRSGPLLPHSLNQLGETVDSMERQCTQDELEEAIGSWLKDTIRRIEADRARKAQAPTQDRVRNTPPPNQQPSSPEKPNLVGIAVVAKCINSAFATQIREVQP